MIALMLSLQKLEHGFVAETWTRAGRYVKIDTRTEARTGAGVYFVEASGTKAKAELGQQPGTGTKKLEQELGQTSGQNFRQDLEKKAGAEVR